MNVDKLNRWLLLVGHVGIIAGLFLVAVQMRQDHALTRAVLYSDATTARMELHYRMMDPAVATVVIKSLTDPSALSFDELRIMDSYLLAVVNEHRRRLVLERMGLDSDFGAPENMLLFYFGNRFAKTWWARFKGDGEEADATLLALDTEIAAFDEDWTIQFFRGLLDDLESAQN